MGTRLSILTLLAATMFFSSTAKDVLTPQEAKHQLEQHIQNYLCANFHIDKFVKKNRVDNGLNALKKEGYIDIVSTTAAGPGSYEIVVLPKGKTLFIKEENKKLYFKVADIALTINSVKEQPAKNGNTVYYVEYREKLTRTRFLELWGVNHCFDGTEYPTHATITHTKNGWKTKHQYFN